MNYPTIKQLRYYIALVDNNHFGKAAQSCYVSQSAFSVAIKELENILEGRLVDRTNKSVIITNLGKEIYKQAKLVVQELTQLIELCHGDNKPLSGKLSLGIIPTIAPFLLQKIIIKLQKKHPNLELYLHEGMTLNLYEKLIKGDIDILLMALPYSLKNIESQIIFKDRFYLAHSKKSKWVVEHKRKISLINESILLLEDGHCMREHALAACKIKSYDNISKYAASSVLTLIEMVKSDIGVTYLPEMSLNSTIVKQSNLVISKVADNSYRDIGLVWRKGSSRVEEFEMLADFIKTNIR